MFVDGRLCKLAQGSYQNPEKVRARDCVPRSHPRSISLSTLVHARVESAKYNDSESGNVHNDRKMSLVSINTLQNTFRSIWTACQTVLMLHELLLRPLISP